jgi:hypothetical protein
LERLDIAILSVHLELAGFLEIEQTDIFRKSSIDDVPISPRKTNQHMVERVADALNNPNDPEGNKGILISEIELENDESGSSSPVSDESD